MGPLWDHFVVLSFRHCSYKVSGFSWWRITRSPCLLLRTSIIYNMFALGIGRCFPTPSNNAIEPNIWPFACIAAVQRIKCPMICRGKRNGHSLSRLTSPSIEPRRYRQERTFNDVPAFISDPVANILCRFDERRTGSCKLWDLSTFWLQRTEALTFQARAISSFDGEHVCSWLVFPQCDRGLRVSRNERNVLDYSVSNNHNKTRHGRADRPTAVESARIASSTRRGRLIWDGGESSSTNRDRSLAQRRKSLLRRSSIFSNLARMVRGTQIFSYDCQYILTGGPNLRGTSAFRSLRGAFSDQPNKFEV